MKPKTLLTDEIEVHNLGTTISVDESLLNVGAGGTDISPSPVIGHSSTRRSRSFRRAKEHNDLYGCHWCFLAVSH